MPDITAQRPTAVRARVCALLAGLLVTAGAAAPTSAQIPSTFTNLEVLPGDISRAELVATMRGFASALDVRCNFCHVGDDPSDFTGYDFASDDKEVKRVAREMMRMRNEINGRLLAATGRDDRLEVGCETCHRGVRRPISLADEMLRVASEDGAEVAVARYRELREGYYGRAAYDFGQGQLNTATETLLGRGEAETALALIRLNIEHLPEEPYPYFLQAQALLETGDRAGAIASLEKAVALAPDADFFRQQLERLRNPPRP